VWEIELHPEGWYNTNIPLAEERYDERLANAEER